MRDYMTKMGILQKKREEIIRILFGTNGSAVSPNEAAFKDTHARVLQYSIEDYVSLRIIPKLLKNYETSWHAPWLGTQQWTNNSCEPANNLVKLALDWKPARLTDLVHLHELVKAQYQSVERAIIGQGEFVFSEGFVLSANYCLP